MTGRSASAGYCSVAGRSSQGTTAAISAEGTALDRIGAEGIGSGTPVDDGNSDADDVSGVPETLDAERVAGATADGDCSTDLAAVESAAAQPAALVRANALTTVTHQNRLMSRSLVHPEDAVGRRKVLTSSTHNRRA